jgi:hypothetical protein
MNTVRDDEFVAVPSYHNRIGRRFDVYPLPNEFMTDGFGMVVARSKKEKAEREHIPSADAFHEISGKCL